MDSFANLLLDARKQAGLTQKELTLRVGISARYFSRIERGLSAPPARKKVEILLTALRITDSAFRARFFLAAGCGCLEDFTNLSAEQVTL